MLIALLNIVLGFIVLTWSADKLVTGSVGLAKSLGVAPLIIGLTIVALGTALPEIVVSILASIQSNSGLAIGNAIGSNITNIGLVIGLCALTHPLVIERVTIRLELPILLISTMGASALMYFLGLNLLTGILMCIGALLYIVWLVIRGQKDRLEEDPALLDEMNQEFHLEESVPLSVSLFWVLLGLVLLMMSAKFLIDGAVEVALWLGISDVVIGLTLVAFGTSLPELAASMAATLKKEHGIAVGNVIGSNIFNLTAVLCAPALFGNNPEIQPRVFHQDIPFMLFLSFIFFVFAYHKNRSGKISRLGGFLFLSTYLVYMVMIGVQSVKGA